MVMIVNGEIVNDNDPRLRQRSLSNASSLSHPLSHSPYLSNPNVNRINSSSSAMSSQQGSATNSSPLSYYGNTLNNNNNLNIPSNYGYLGSQSPYTNSPYYTSPYHTLHNSNNSSHITPFSLPQSSDHFSHSNPSSRSIYQPSAPSSSTSSGFSSPTLINGSPTSRPYTNYSLFGLPPVFFYDLCIPPHIYLPTILLLYLIGPTSLLAIVPAFLFYRWHLLREAEKAARERTLEKFLPFKDAKTRKSMQLSSSSIHTITDWQQTSSSPMGM